ncbi:guanine nucleotide-binding protein subunit alpha homolog isoform X2 [Stegodyphus dumicola]|uniref:guanine nucleotide-binding protein subunit alpha homolog isoform X2 n=1 Tax=Stegodyphus dumicola TaxID=202533 RepID=UPI0015AAF30C|nr:guanine nucleotide-binding protein subunit alpha homolog isoform X2 [Stegodyphus dumicola]
MAGVWQHLTCCLRLKYTPEEAQQHRKSKKIDKMLRKDKNIMRRQVKLLLLGAGESGKSTFLKQMKIIHGDNFDTDSVAQYKATIYQNTIKGMKVLVDARAKLGIPWENPESSKYANHVLMYENYMTLDLKTFQDFAYSVQELWKDQSVRTAYHRRREFQLGDNVLYFFENLTRLASPGYVPSNLDILHARAATKTINEYLTLINNIPFRFVDVGGQRSQRQKWVQCFEDVTSILFLVSSSEFDQVLLEDRTTNRILESKNIFDTIINNRCFSEVSVILFMNKTDLLQEKLSRKDVDIRQYFPEFTGDPYNVEAVQMFFVNMFDQIRRDRKRPFYYHFTTAIDTENIKVVFSAVKDTILQKNINQLMLQ